MRAIKVYNTDKTPTNEDLAIRLVEIGDLTPTRKGLAGVGKHFEWLNKNKRDYAKAFKTATKLAQKGTFG